MIQHVIFDLDGVLFDGCDFHRDMFIAAVSLIRPDIHISNEYHWAHLNALSTRKKLEVLDIGNDSEAIFAKKQELARSTIKGYIQYDEKVFGICKALVSYGYNIYCVSNSIRSTVETCLSGMGVIHLFTSIISNEDTLAPKPSPEPYLTLYRKHGLDPRECLILEDSDHGVQSAQKSGGNVLRVRNCSDVTLAAIMGEIARLQITPDATLLPECGSTCLVGRC